ncbi:MAG: hypothetical protein JSV49_01915 [Thermoplasmata archaeon]|nr:MAG: hypothetical protein JSV49_01915 [Thermoplasmata archaeon]
MISLHGLVLISGGIDSPVAAALMLQQKVKLSAVFFDAWPFADKEQSKKVQKLIEHLQKVFDIKIPLYIIPHSKNLTEIGRECSRKLGCVLCRRMMLRTASKLATSKSMDFLVTGESLGQVASQTLPNLHTETPSSSILILRPLIGLDKIEIEQKAKEFGTYEISISPGMCCTMAPKFPVTYSNISVVESEEKRLNLLNLVKYSLENAKKT